MKNKNLLALASILVIGVGVHADSVDQRGILRDSHGKVHNMNQVDAIKACAQHGMHLPTVRELLQLNQAAGITIEEPNTVSEGELKIGAVHPVVAVNPNGKVDRFYYDNDDYAIPSIDLGIEYFWSSSAQDGSLGYYFETKNGTVYTDDIDDVVDNGAPAWFAVRCMAGKF